MARRIKVSRGLATAAMLGFLSPALHAQTTGLPASDPVGISRSGAGVAYGRSLEAASLNPAILPTLEGRFEYFLSAGQELQSAQISLQSSHQPTIFSTDRNRFVPSLGLGWKLGSSFALGLKVDTPFEHHARFSSDSPARFFGDEIDLKAQRVELQWGMSLRNNFSIGIGAGFAKIDTASGTTLRGIVPGNPSSPVSGTNPAEGLIEQRVRQSGSVTVPSFSGGFRWAIGPRWTLGGSYQGGLRGTTTQTARLTKDPFGVYANDGFSTPLSGTNAKASTVLGLSSAIAGSNRVSLPARAAIGLRSRVNQIFTWEADIRYSQGTQFEFPTLPSFSTPSGVVKSPQISEPYNNTVGLSLMGELRLNKNWVARGGASLDQGSRKDTNVDPLLGGQRQAAFSIGFGWKVMGGEVNFGYQYRQAQDQDPTNLDGVWSSAGFRPTGTTTRIEGMGHLFAIGFKKSF